MADLKTDLAECVRLHGAATEGPWDIKTNADWSDGFNFFGGRDGAYTFPVALEPADRDLLQALHNLFHDHGDELLAAVRDAARYRWLATAPDQKWVKFHFQKPGYEAYGPVQNINRKPWLDEAIDAAQKKGEE